MLGRGRRSSVMAPNTGDLNKMQVSSRADARERVSILGSAVCLRAYGVIWTHQPVQYGPTSQCNMDPPASAIWTNPAQYGPNQRNMDQPSARSSDATLTQGVIRRTRTSKYSSARCTARAPDATLRGATRSPKMLLCWRWTCLAPLLVEPRGLISCLSSAEQRC
jgi:hypothetical protein